MTAQTLAERLRNHAAPSRAEMAAYADEVEALAVTQGAKSPEQMPASRQRVIDTIPMQIHVDPPPPRLIPVAVPCPRCGYRP